MFKNLMDLADFFNLKRISEKTVVILANLSFPSAKAQSLMAVKCKRN